MEGGPETNSAKDLLSVGFGIWLYTILAFAFLYWVLDGGGPDARLWAPREYPNLAFPEQLNPVVAAPGWRPQFFDYLYLGFTNATAFSPTDVMPLARWAKAAMTMQAARLAPHLGTGDRPGRQYPAVAIPECFLILRGGMAAPGPAGRLRYRAIGPSGLT